ncbi:MULTISPECIES: heavy-metal-associated domain-containing protein [Flavobacterium]|uniref:heavy-metal-associated domain-containing protein n=1 Tax=Flavobacterium TaxID=237 RepID=UPI001FCB1FFA|nr:MULTISPECIES: metal transporter [Flavobacterium]UOK42689.1 metal transporter [Flavobacterium enshiense]
MKNIIVILLISFFGFTAQAQEKKNKNAKADVEVKGNCDMCKKRIEKAAYSVVGVKSAVWHSDDQVLHLVFNEQKCSLEDVEKSIAKAGHDTKDVKAPEDSYNNLHTCCQYDR